MEKLKALFGSEALTWEQLEAKLKDNKEIKLANLAGGTVRRQIDAVRAAANAIGAIKNGELNEGNAAEILGGSDLGVGGDRSGWAEKAEASLANVRK